MKREKEVEALKLIIAENTAKYSRAGMPYEEALKMCALGILASGFGKVDELNDEIAGLTGKVEALEQDNENLLRTIEESPEVIEEAKREKAQEILSGLVHWLKGAIRDSYEKALRENISMYNGGKNNAFHEMLDLVKKVAEKEGVEVDE